jgi:hypothetical protein
MANVAKITKGIVKAATKSKKPSLKAAQKAKPLANPKSAVKIKPPAKTRGASYNTAKGTERYVSSQRRSWGPETGYEEGPLFPGKLKDVRVRKSKNQSASGKASAPSKGAPLARHSTIKINSAPKKK